MARVVVHEENKPLKLTEADLDEEKGNIAICQCGLSADYPFCDGSHRDTAGEIDELLYQYDACDSTVRSVVTRIITTDTPEPE
jgi:CDGSH-type Zn-finger protein